MLVDGMEMRANREIVRIEEMCCIAAFGMRGVRGAECRNMTEPHKKTLLLTAAKQQQQH